MAQAAIAEVSNLGKLPRIILKEKLKNVILKMLL